MPFDSLKLYSFIILISDGENTTLFCGVFGRMAETAQLIELLKRQIDAQQKQMEEGRKQTEALVAAFIGHTDKREQPSPKAPLVVIPSLVPFDPRQNWGTITGQARFQTSVGANSIPTDKLTSAGFPHESVESELQASE